MKTFLAIYIGTVSAHERSGWDELDEEARSRRIKQGLDAWMAWNETNAAAIVAGGAPLGKTKRTGIAGVTDIKNAMTGYVIVRAESHEAAARMFEGHPHFTIFPGDSVEIMEILPVPAA